MQLTITEISQNYKVYNCFLIECYSCKERSKYIDKRRQKVSLNLEQYDPIQTSVDLCENYKVFRDKKCQFTSLIIIICGRCYFFGLM